MKKFLRNAVIAATFLGAAFGAVSSADAFIYGLYDQNDSKYPMQMESISVIHISRLARILMKTLLKLLQKMVPFIRLRLDLLSGI